MAEEQVQKAEVTDSGGSKLWKLLKRYGLVGALGTLLVSVGTWAFTTIDNLKDENIAMKQQLIEERNQREAMWMRLYYQQDQQQKLSAQVEVNKQLYNMLIYSKKELKDLPRQKFKSIDETEDIRPKTYEDFKRESLRQIQAPSMDLEQRIGK